MFRENVALPRLVNTIHGAGYRCRLPNRAIAALQKLLSIPYGNPLPLTPALQDATGDKPGIVVVEIPTKPQWCELRQIVFGWTEVQFPFRVQSGRKLKLSQSVVVTVIDKAFFDIGHAPADHGNRRTDLAGYAAWEIHPVMALQVVQ